MTFYSEKLNINNKYRFADKNKISFFHDFALISGQNFYFFPIPKENSNSLDKINRY